MSERTYTPADLEAARREEHERTLKDTLKAAISEVEAGSSEVPALDAAIQKARREGAMLAAAEMRLLMPCKHQKACATTTVAHLHDNDGNEGPLEIIGDCTACERERAAVMAAYGDAASLLMCEWTNGGGTRYEGSQGNGSVHFSDCRRCRILSRTPEDAEVICVEIDDLSPDPLWRKRVEVEARLNEAKVWRNEVNSVHSKDSLKLWAERRCDDAYTTLASLRSPAKEKGNDG